MPWQLPQVFTAKDFIGSSGINTLQSRATYEVAPRAGFDSSASCDGAELSETAAMEINSRGAKICGRIDFISSYSPVGIPSLHFLSLEFRFE